MFFIFILNLAICSIWKVLESRNNFDQQLICEMGALFYDELFLGFYCF